APYRCATRTSPSPRRKEHGGLDAGAAAKFRIMPMVTRREAVIGLTASAASLALPSVARAQSSARVVVIGGGFGGASCARALRRLDAKLQVTLVEANKTFTTCPFSNEVIA